MTKPTSLILEEVVNTMSAAVARATKGMHEFSDAIAEFREAEMMLRGLAPARSRSAKSTVLLGDPIGTLPTVAREDRRASDRDAPWRVNELASTLKVNRRTIERRIKDGTLKASKVVGLRLIDAKSVKAMFEPAPDPNG